MIRTLPVPQWLAPLTEVFASAGSPLFIVGGYVRNILCGLPPHDVDCAGSLRPDTLAALLDIAGIPYVEKQKELGTFEIFLGENTVEYTPFRIESYSPGGSHRPYSVAFTDNISEDALRRDFTVNAIYCDSASGELYDPLGGVSDIEQKLLRACRPDPCVTFQDDGLRVMRLCRIAGELGFSPEPITIAAAVKFAGNLLSIAPQRIYSELVRILVADTLYGVPDGHYSAMRLMLDSGALFALIPELSAGAGVMQKPKYHKYDVLEHNLHVFRETPPDIALRTSGLLHDVGKPAAAAKNNGDMYGHQIESHGMSLIILPRLDYPADLAAEISMLIRLHMFDLDGKAKVSTCRMRFASWGFAFTEKLIALRKADVLGSGMKEHADDINKWQKILFDMRSEGAVDNMRSLAITGDDIMQATGSPPSELIGRIKLILFERAAVDPSINNHDRLIAEAVRLYRTMHAYKKDH